MAAGPSRNTGKPGDPLSSDSKTYHAIDESAASSILKAVKKPVDTADQISEEDLEVLQHDLAAAGKIQSRLLPEQVPQASGYDFAAYYSPAGHVGGDFYDFIQFDKDHLGILVADASGKGLSGSLLMVEARAVIRAMASINSSPGEVLRRANRVLLRDLRKGMFITLYYAVLRLSKGTLAVASAGHMPMLLWRWKTRKCYAVNPSGLVLGAATEEMFDQTVRETSVQLEPGDRFVLYTDGVTELMDPRQNEYGKGRFVRLTLDHSRGKSEDYVRRIVADLTAHRGGQPQSDDITIVTGRFAAEEEMWGSTNDPQTRARGNGPRAQGR